MDLLKNIVPYLSPNDRAKLAATNSFLHAKLSTLPRLAADRVIGTANSISSGDKKASKKPLRKAILQLQLIKGTPAGADALVALAGRLPHNLCSKHGSLNENGTAIYKELIRLLPSLPPASRDRVLLALDNAFKSCNPPTSVRGESATLQETFERLAKNELGESALFSTAQIIENKQSKPIVWVNDNSQIQILFPGRESSFFVDNFHDAKVICQLACDAPTRIMARYGDKVQYLDARGRKHDKSKPAIWLSAQDPRRFEGAIPGIADDFITRSFNTACVIIDRFLTLKEGIEIRYGNRVTYSNEPLPETDIGKIGKPTVYPEAGGDSRLGAVMISMPHAQASHAAPRLGLAFELIDAIEHLKQETEKQFKGKIAFIGGPSKKVENHLTLRVAQNGSRLELWLPGGEVPAFVTKDPVDPKNISATCGHLVSSADEIFARCKALTALPDRVRLVTKLSGAPAEPNNREPRVASNAEDATRLDLYIPGEASRYGMNPDEVNAAIDPWRGSPQAYGNAVRERFGEDVIFYHAQPRLSPPQAAIWPGDRNGSFICFNPDIGAFAVARHTSATNFREVMNLAAKGLEISKIKQALHPGVTYTTALPTTWNGMEPLVSISSTQAPKLDALIPGRAPLNGVDIKEVNDAYSGWTIEKAKFEGSVKARTDLDVQFLTKSPAGRPSGLAVWPSRSIAGAVGYTLPGSRVKYIASTHSPVQSPEQNLKEAMSQLDEAARRVQTVRQRMNGKFDYFSDAQQQPGPRGAIWVGSRDGKGCLMFKLPNQTRTFVMSPGTDKSAFDDTIAVIEARMLDTK